MHKIRRYSGILTQISLLFVGLLCSANAGQPLKTGHVPAAVSQLTQVRRLESGRRLKLAIGMPLRNEAELKELLQRLCDPTSADYRQWLTPEQFTERFGPAPADYEAVAAFAAANDLVVTVRHPNRIVLDVEGSAEQIEKAFHVNLRVYRHPTEDREFFAPDVEPALDLPVTVLDISGLDDFWLPKPRHRVKDPAQAAKARPNAGSGPGGSYRGNDFRAAYVPGSPLNGSGQSVGLS